MPHRGRHDQVCPCPHPGGTADYTTYLGAGTIIEAAHPDLRIPASESRCFTGAAAVQPADEDETTGTLHWYVYDAWNRLVEVRQNDGDGSQEITGQTPDDTQIAAYEYDPASRSRYVGPSGLHRRIVTLVPNGENWDRTDYYYNTAWQVLEERVATSQANEDTVATSAKYQYVWDIRYIDAPVCRDEDLTSDGDCTDAADDVQGSNSGDEHLYYCNDANMNVTALVDGYDGAVVERYLYDAYGQPTVLHGVRDSAGTDTSGSEWSERTSNDFDNVILYCGYRRDSESGLYQVRYRYYDPALGRWGTRDPAKTDIATENSELHGDDSDPALAGAVPSEGLYCAFGSSPVARVDPEGRQWTEALAKTGCSWETGRATNVFYPPYNALCPWAQRAVDAHESEHRSQQSSCCKRYAKCIKRARNDDVEKQRCLRRWKLWMGANSPRFECTAYRASRDVAAWYRFWASDKECCSDLERIKHDSELGVRQNCPNSRSRYRCPFASDGHIRSRVLVGELPPGHFKDP